MVFDLFMTIITQCEVDDPGELWNEKKEYIAEKFFRKHRCTPQSASPEQTEVCYDECLLEIKKQLAILLGGGKKVSNRDLNIPEPAQCAFINTPKIILEELAYDTDEQLELNDQRTATLKEDQKKVPLYFLIDSPFILYFFFVVLKVYEDLLYHVYDVEPTDGSVPVDTRKKKDREGFITFIDAPGGTGKTYALNTFLNYVRGQADIGLASAFSGVAALLLTGGT